MTGRARIGRAQGARPDAAIRAAEDAAYAVHGKARSEGRLKVASGYGRIEVRLSDFGGTGDQPPVLLFHGIGSLAVLMAPLLPFLGGRRVIAVDWPGHGLSDPCLLPPGADIRQHAGHVTRSIVDYLDLREVDIIGHSMGAQFALYAGLDLADRVRRLVLLGAPGAAFAGIRPLVAMKLLALPTVGPLLLSRPMSERAFDRFNDEVLGVGALDSHHPELRTAMLAFSSRTDNGRSLASYFRAMVVRGQVRPGIALAERELERLQQQTLVLWGDEDVFLRPVEAARSLVSIRDAHVVRVPGAGHAPWLQDPERVGTAVAHHLNNSR